MSIEAVRVAKERFIIMAMNRVRNAIKDLSWISANMSMAKMPEEAGKLLDAAMLLDEIASQPLSGIPTQRYLDILWSFEGQIGPIIHDLDGAFRANKTFGELEKGLSNEL